MGKRLKTAFWGWIWIYSLAGNSLGYALDIPVQESDVIITVGVGPTSSFSRMSVGDFDGDGFDDVAWGYSSIYYPTTEGSLTTIFPGKNLPKRSNFNDVVRWRFSNGILGAFGDYDGNGRSDLVAQVIGSESSYHSMVLSKAGKDGPWNFIQPDDAVRVLGVVNPYEPTGLSGDLTGDGIGDLIVSDYSASSAGRAQNGKVSILPGRKVWADSTNWALDPSSITIFGANSGDYLGGNPNPIEGDINKDGREDLVINGESGIYVIFGSTSLPNTWDLAVKPADGWVGPGGTNGPKASALGDVNGDGWADLFFSWMNKLYLLDGKIIASHSIIDLTPGSPTEQPIILMKDTGGYPEQCADFDGDGQSDLISMGDSPPVVSITLSSSYSGWPAFPSEFKEPNIRITSGKQFLFFDVGDLNNDGFSDIVFGESWGSIYVIYGFRPLTRPTLVIGPPEVETTRVLVTLSVDGDPTEMKFSGALTDTFKDKWIPFQPTKTLTLTSPAEQKNLTIRFRNAFGRESETATGTVTLHVEDQRTEVATNLITADQPAKVECRMNAPGKLRAYVVSRMGQKIVDVLDVERGIGVWPVEWNGTNDEGRRVAPGVYVLMIEFGDQKFRAKVLVRE